MRQYRETHSVDVLEYGVICHYVVLQLSDAVICNNHIYNMGVLLWGEQPTSSTRYWFSYISEKNIWMILVIDPSLYESTGHYFASKTTALTLLTSSCFKISGCLDTCNSMAVEIWLNLLPSLPHAHPIIDNMVNNSHSDFISYCVPDSSFSFSSSSYFFTPSSLSSSSSHPSYSLSNIGLHCCSNQMFTRYLFIALRLWFVSECII